MKTSVIAAVWIGVVATVPAWASSGTMSGTFQFTQRQENCGNGVNAKYPCGQYNTPRPVRNSRVEIRRASDNALLGAGTTNNLGGFNVAWTDNSASGNVSVLVWWRSQQADDRYRMTDAAGGLYYFWVPAQTAVNGANTGIGTWTWGTNNLANVWDGANMMWYYSLSQTNRMNAFFGTITPAGAGATRYVEIRAFV